MAQQLPTQSQFGDYSDWPGRDVLDSSGQRLGGVREIYLDRETGRPEWVLVDTDDGKARFVPLLNADVETWSIRVAVPADKIRSAPAIGTEPRIDESEERRLYAHYGLSHGGAEDGGRAEETGWSSADTTRSDSPSWQARGGETPGDDAAARTDEPTNVAPPPAEPPSSSELESAQIPEEPPAASDRGAEYETAPFGAVSPPADDTEKGSYSLTEDTRGGEDKPAPFGKRAGGDTPLSAETSPADDPAAAFLTDDTAGAAEPTDSLGDEARDGDPTSPARDTPALDAGPDAPKLAAGPDTPELPAAPPPPVTADKPVAADTPSAKPDFKPEDLKPHAAPPHDTPKPSGTSSPPAGGALERAKRQPKQVAIAAAAAAVLFFIVRKLR